MLTDIPSWSMSSRFYKKGPSLSCCILACDSTSPRAWLGKHCQNKPACDLPNGALDWEGLSCCFRLLEFLYWCIILRSYSNAHTRNIPPWRRNRRNEIKQTSNAENLYGAYICTYGSRQRYHIEACGPSCCIRVVRINPQGGPLMGRNDCLTARQGVCLILYIKRVNVIVAISLKEKWWCQVILKCQASNSSNWHS